MLALATLVTSLLRSRMVLALACVWTTLLTTSLASAGVGVQPQTRVWAFELGGPLNAHSLGSASPQTHPGFSSAQAQLASASPPAARGTASGARSVGAAAADGMFQAIAGTRGLEHSFSRHAAQWFGREVSSASHLGRWQSLIERAAASSKQFVSNVGGDATVAHLARIDGKNFVVHFYQGGPRAGELATAFVPTRAQVGAYLRALQ